MSDPDPITRLNAALEGRYRIERELGEGGDGGPVPLSVALFWAGDGRCPSLVLSGDNTLTGSGRTV